MADPFIVAHQRGPRFYSIGGKLNPVSLRDQFLRGEMIIHRLAHAGLIGRDRHPVVVVGAGAAGVSAAICAAVKHHCKVYLVEKKDKPFSLQETCATRWVDPTLYDHPALHWEDDTYPATQPVIPPADWRVTWDAGLANALVLLWRGQFAIASHQAAGRLGFVGKAITGGFRLDPPTADHVEVDITYVGTNTPHPDSPVKASAVVWAAGFGPEKRYLRDNHVPGQPPPAIHPAWGFEFWGDDPLAEGDYGLPGAAGSPRIVISGSGDGALQDFLRIMTKYKRTREVYDGLFGAGKLILSDSAIRRLHDAADRAARAIGWGGGAAHDHGPLEALHATHVGIVEELYAHQRQAFESAVRDVLRPVLPELKLIHSCNHFANGYPLNRLLVLVLKKYLEETYGKETFFLSGRQVVDIESQNESRHICACDAFSCHGQMHDVFWASRPICQAPAAARDSRNVVSANILVLRHGIDMADLEDDPTPPLARQILPYGPW